VKPWSVLTTKTVLDRPWLTVREQHVRTARGVDIEQYHLIDSVDWVCAVCITADDQVVLVRQYRHGVERPTLELPAGAINAAEDPLEAVKREVLEETGYTAERWTLLRDVHPETTRHRHRAYLYLAQGALRTQPQQLDATEDVEVHLEPWHVELPSQLDHAVHALACFMAHRIHPFNLE
jgi:8-oxo-dGTP pyrophosphatase MutT (NUDIX family)